MVLLAVGYRKTNRNLLLAAALMMWLGAGLNDFTQGFVDGVSRA
ncbi:hypothetical protein [Massilia sp. 9096]|nr:hypothetical protein [Massilia sp. 9096]